MMSSDFLDPELSGISVDESIAKFKWERITKGRSDDDLKTVWDNVSELYWSGVEREVAAAIIAFANFNEHQADSLPVEDYRPEDLRTDHLAELIDLWNPFDAQGPLGAHLGDPNQMHRLKERVNERVADELEFLPLEERRAQALLQALGLTDIDFVREHRRPTFRSLGQRPQIKADEDEYLLEAVQCSNCRHCVRAFHWFECKSGCKDHPDQTNMFSISRPQHADSDDAQRQSLGQSVHAVVLSESLSKILPYTLCPPCFEKSPHPYDHLHVVRRFPEGKFINSKSAAFGLQLDMWEDQLDGRFLMGFGALTLDRLASGASVFSRASTRHIFPAGNTHCAVMLGPLIIENGSRFMPSGARISLRNVPNFSTLSLEDLQDFISDPAEFKWSEGKEVLTQKHLAISHDRLLYSSVHPVQERRFMSTQKQIASGLFTLSFPRVANAERSIIREFIHVSKLWKQHTEEHRFAQISVLRSVLRSFAQRIVAEIKDTHGPRISELLFCIARRLHKSVKFKYDRVFNNCQDFSSAMIFNGDEWDAEFSGVYPRIPPRREQTAETRAMRYMMSFAGKMQHGEFFVSPLTSSLQLYDSFGHNDSDLIDHTINVRTRSWDGGSMLAHDAYLMKNSTMTCEKKTRCSFADHLLDGPHDNISVLTTHIHRKRTLYTVPSGTYDDAGFDVLLMNKGDLEWIQNRLQILHRLRLLNSYLSVLADEFGSLISDDSIASKELLKAWRPVSSQLGRCWSCNKRDGRNIHKPTWLSDSDTGEMNNSRWTLLSTTWHTSPGMQAKQAWKSRYDSLRKQLFAESKSKMEISLTPPGTCDCSSCERIWASRLCSRATRHAASQQSVIPEERSTAYSSSHPDFVPLDQLLSSINLLGTQYKVVTEFLKQLTRTPEYLGYQQSTELQIEMFPDVYELYLWKARFHPTTLQGEYPPFLEWLAAIHNGEDD